MLCAMIHILWENAHAHAALYDCMWCIISFQLFYFSILYSDGKNIMNLMSIMKHKASSFMDKLHVRTIIWK